jgi:5-(carboxyamino)imidazole ribonucleotide synthase
MFAGAAHRMGYRIAVWDPDPDAPAHRIAGYSFSRSFADRQTLDEFSGLASVVTYEWENVPATLCRELEQRKPVRPSSAILGIIQDRIAQKAYLRAQNFPVTQFSPVTSPGQLAETIRRIGFPAVCKTATAGYDGKGQWRLKDESDLREARQAVEESHQRGTRWIVETFVPFERELSVLVVRGVDGATVVYPTAENEHEDGILRMTIVPARIPSWLAERAGELARQVVERLDGIGVFCLELFQLTDGELLINEIAPRPHNSGHYTLDACSVSQFEQQVRAVCGLPLGEVRLMSPATMVNLIGDDAVNVTREDGCRALLSVPGAVLHLYGKRTMRPRRKMGHVTFLASEGEMAQDRAVTLRDRLAKAALIERR